MASFGAWELKATGYRETEDRDGLCVSIFTAIGSPISAVYSWINNAIRPMTKNTSLNRLADA